LFTIHIEEFQHVFPWKWTRFCLTNP
jgi:hypothetical protein